MKTFLAINTLTVSREGSLLGVQWYTELIDCYALELNRGSPVHWRQRLSQAQASPLVAMRTISTPEMQALGNTCHHCLLKATVSFVFWGFFRDFSRESPAFLLMCLRLSVSSSFGFVFPNTHFPWASDDPLGKGSNELDADSDPSNHSFISCPNQQANDVKTHPRLPFPAVDGEAPSRAFCLPRTLMTEQESIASVSEWWGSHHSCLRTLPHRAG